MQVHRTVRGPSGAPFHRRLARLTGSAGGGALASRAVALEDTTRPYGLEARRAGARRGLLVSLLAGVGLLVSLTLPGFAGAAVTAPGDILTFPQRDFVSASGYLTTHTFTVEVLHAGSVTPVGTVTVKELPAPGAHSTETVPPCWPTI